MLGHILDIYWDQGVRHFLIAGGYRGEVIRQWLQTVVAERHIEYHETGEDTETGGRIAGAYARSNLAAQEPQPFFLTYGDGLADINLVALLEHHANMRRKKGVLVTLTAVNPPSRFGALDIRNGMARVFLEKRQMDGWINGGFYVVEPEALRLIPAASGACRWEYDILPMLALQGRLAAYQHAGWWQCMDTPRDLAYLRQVAANGNCPWQRWRST
jgi:glucose-1-phosphate cytidylyltransferase